MMKDKKSDKEKITIKFCTAIINNYNYMINDERQKKDKEKITIVIFFSLIIIIICMIND